LKLTRADLRGAIAGSSILLLGQPGRFGRITEINAGAGDSLIAGLRVHGDRLYFKGDDGGAATVTEPWQVLSDTTPPETTIDSGPAEGETVEVVETTFTFLSNEPGSTVSCLLD